MTLQLLFFFKGEAKGFWQLAVSGVQSLGCLQFAVNVTPETSQGAASLMMLCDQPLGGHQQSSVTSELKTLSSEEVDSTDFEVF